MPDDKFTIQFHPSGRGKARCPSNPQYPNGIYVHGEQKGQKACEVDLPYPAPECGAFTVTCSECDYRMIITAAGRPDDPRKLFIPCNPSKS